MSKREKEKESQDTPHAGSLLRWLQGSQELHPDSHPGGRAPGTQSGWNISRNLDPSGAAVA